MDAPPGKPKKRWYWRVLRFVVVVYVGVAIGMWFLENHLVFRGETSAENWQDPPDPMIEEVTFRTADGVQIHSWYLPVPKAEGVVLFCHGNGGNVSYSGDRMGRIRDHLGYSTLAIDYPGYGKSEGKPNEAKCYAAAEAAFRWLTEEKKIPASRIILFGDSLGGGVAVEMATRHEHRALVLAKSFTSLPAVAQRMYRWLPVRWLMRNRFDNLSKIPNCTGPVFIANGTKDGLVPYAHGEELFGAANEPKLFFPLVDQDHNDKLPDEFMLALRQFLNEHPAK
jgi:fermentation-respiration switch protein FrsA (DUF1100 family)